MLVLRPISSGQARYYLEGPAPGWWLGGGAECLHLHGPVTEPALYGVLAGQRPSGETLLARIPKNRRSGFDLILAAPKSVSLLAALSDPTTADRFSAAHQQAVCATIGYLERNAAWTRRADSRLATSGFVAAAYTHRQSGAGDPHLHSHVVVANLVQCRDGKWSALDSRSLFRHARSASAVYQATLRYHLAEQGLRFGWTIRPSGLGDIRGVPRAAIEAGSLRHRQVAQELASGLVDGPKARATIAGVTRRDSNLAGAGPWARRVAAAGLDAQAAAQVIDQARGIARSATRIGPHDGRSFGSERQPRTDERAIAALLSEQHSRFRREDAVRAVAVLATEGAPASDLEAAADRFLRTAVPLEPGAWTTANLRQMEERIVAAALAVAAPTGLSSDRLRPGVGVAGASISIPDRFGQPARQAVQRLARGGAPVDLLGGEFLSQAEVLDVVRAGWEASGHRVVLVTQTDRAQERWRTMAGLEGRPLASSPPKGSVVLVDGADRWSTRDLHTVIADATARRAKVVLLDGGTQTRRRQPESPAVAVLRQRLSVIDPGPSCPRRLMDETPDAPTVPVVQAGRGAAVMVAPSAQAAIDQIIDDWSRLRAAGARPRMVALGREEAEALNARARVALAGAGTLRGPTVEIGGRPFQAGDEVTALRRDHRLGAAVGAVGRVNSVDPQQQQVTIEWRGRDDPVEVAATGAPPALGYSYATTPAYFRHGNDGVLLSLGAVETLVASLHPDRVYTVLPASGGLAPGALVGDVAPLRGPAQSGRPGDAAMAALVAEVSDPPVALPCPPAGVHRPLGELCRERDGLASQLLARAPADPRPAMRQLEEERAWLVARGGRPGQGAALAGLDDRSAALTRALGDRERWLDEQREPLLRWTQLSQAVAWREAALGYGALLRPTVAVESHLGSPPTADDGHLGAWRRAAEVIEAHRDRWDLPDHPLELGPAGDLRRTPASQQRILAATRQLDHARDRSLGWGADRSLGPG